MDAAAESERLLAHDARWSALSKRGQDVEGILGFWADDAVVYPPGMPPVMGRDALREYVTSSLAIPGFSIEWAAERAVLSQDGTMGYTTGTNAITMNGDDGLPTTLPGRYVAVWRRTAGGGWKCVEDVLIPAQ